MSSSATFSHKLFQARCNVPQSKNYCQIVNLKFHKKCEVELLDFFSWVSFFGWGWEVGGVLCPHSLPHTFITVNEFWEILTVHNIKCKAGKDWGYECQVVNLLLFSGKKSTELLNTCITISSKLEKFASCLHQRLQKMTVHIILTLTVRNLIGNFKTIEANHLAHYWCNASKQEHHPSCISAPLSEEKMKSELETKDDVIIVTWIMKAL